MSNDHHPLIGLIERTLIPHTAYQRSSKLLDGGLRRAQLVNQSSCIVILGESRTGKSRLLKELKDRNTSKRTSEGLEHIVVHATTPPKPTTKSFAAEILHRLGDPFPSKGNEAELRVRVETLLRETGTKALLIDEFQHLYDKAREQTWHDIADWIKVITEGAGIMVALVGLPYAREVVYENPQLVGRAMNPIELPRFDWRNSTHQIEFRGILAAFNEVLSPHLELPELESPEMAYRFWCATGGLMGLLTKLLDQLCWNAMEDDLRVVTLDHFSEAHKMAVADLKSGGGLHPFGQDFDLRLTEASLWAALSINAPADVEALPGKEGRRRRSKRKRAAAPLLPKESDSP
ncbi:MAG TPA: hypothetical protein DDW98_02485 [Gammaproteobacteria bacterium]|nr:hypothetical protein [Gammaproteobacteria bacterium]